MLVAAEVMLLQGERDAQKKHLRLLASAFSIIHFSTLLIFKISEATDGGEHTLNIVPSGVAPVEAQTVEHGAGVAVVTIYDCSLLSVGIQIILIASDKSYSSCHSHHIKMFGISEQV